MRTLALVLALCLVSAPFAPTAEAGTACPSVSISPYGAGCNPAGFDVPALKAAYDATGCQLFMKWSGLTGCCNTFLTGRLFLIGASQASVPAPGGCTLLVVPSTVVFLPAAVDNFQVTIPPVPSLVTVYTQVANQYTTFGIQNDYNLTNGVAMKIL